MSEFGGLWKQQNNPACTKSVGVFIILKLDTTEEEEEYTEGTNLGDTASDSFPLFCLRETIETARALRSAAVKESVQSHRHRFLCREHYKGRNYGKVTKQSYTVGCLPLIRVADHHLRINIYLVLRVRACVRACVRECVCV